MITRRHNRTNRYKNRVDARTNRGRFQQIIKRLIFPFFRVNSTITKNNTMYNFTNLFGAIAGGKGFSTFTQSSLGFHGNRKLTFMSTVSTTQTALEKFLEHPINKLRKKLTVSRWVLWFSGRNRRLRKAMVRAIRFVKVVASLIIDATPISHNGVRLRKKRRG